MSPAPVLLLVNPAAGRGRSRARVRDAVAALETVAPVHVRESAAPGDEARLAAAPEVATARALVVLGGDGTVSHAARGLLAAGHRTPLAVLCAGTGNDLAKSLGTPSHQARALACCLAAGHTRPLDVGTIDGVPFVNAAGLGFDEAVLHDVRDPARAPWLRGAPRYVALAARQLFRYPGLGGVRAPPLPHDPPRWLMLVAANGQWFGGAFRIAPDARLDSGALVLVGVADAPPLARVALFARALRGAHVGHPAVHVAHGASFTVHCPVPPAFEADGEWHQAASAAVTIAVRPGALRALAPAPPGHAAGTTPPRRD
jgi:diacylglycerol kinase (ATP)